MTRQSDRQTFKNEDLVLKVSTSIDPAVWDEARYEAFLDGLCGNREYQKDATRTVMRFLAGQKYRNLRELAKETFDNNPEMERRYFADVVSRYSLRQAIEEQFVKKVEDVAIEFERAVSGDHTKFKTTIEHKTYSFDEVAEEMYRRLQSIDDESKDAEDPRDRTQYAKKFPFERCLEIVKASAKKARIKSGRIAEENRQKILQALGPLRRKLAKRVVYKLTPKALLTLNTSGRQDVSTSAAELRRGDKTVFLTPDFATTIPEEQKDFFAAVTDPDGDYRAGCEHVPNAHDFKTPCNMAVADATPERKFIRQLCARENAVAVDAWLKNAPQRFYAIEYAWKKGEHPKRGDFSPDFFIRKSNTVYVVEIKDDGEIADPSPENQKKCEYARDHFARLSQWLKREGIDAEYQLNFLTPKDFNKSFVKLRKDEAKGFRSELDTVLGQGGDEHAGH